ncbi:MAG: 30S ribosomal protein S16 [candidate division Zixibacteria bacterium]|nr:30S ribosomal protein S16 [candidate division Zixibacteria bacterium]
MPAVIRLRRGGRRNRPIYRVVATDSRMPRDGRFLEVLGWYRPLERPGKVELNVERTLGWLRQGAVPSNTVAALFVHTGMAQIWQKAQRGEDYGSVTLLDSVREKPHKVKARARARMSEAAGAQKEGGAAA